MDDGKVFQPPVVGAARVPATVWPGVVLSRCPGGPHSGVCAHRVGPGLVGPVVAAFSGRGAVVGLAPGDVPALMEAVADAGRVPWAGTRARLPELVIALPTCPAGAPRPPTVDEAQARGLFGALAAGGLAVVLGPDPALSAQPSAVARWAAAAGLVYLQHLVAVHALIEADRWRPADPDWAAAARAEERRHVRIHSDVLIYRRPGLGEVVA